MLFARICILISLTLIPGLLVPSADSNAHPSGSAWPVLLTSLSSDTTGAGSDTIPEFVTLFDSASPFDIQDSINADLPDTINTNQSPDSLPGEQDPPEMPDQQDLPEMPYPDQQNRQPDNDRSDVHFSSSDSLIFTTRGERRATLYGNARVGNEKGELTAGEVLLNLDQNQVSAQATTPEDTLSEPVLQRGEDRVRSQRIQYNYETDKGKFDVARITMDQGNVIGTQVKRTAPHVVFVEDGIFSTCELDHPHFYIRAARMKVVDEEEVFFTRARLFILDIPYPFVFPFGYVPSRITQEQSGILEPSFTYQDQQRRGIGVQNLGWFQYFNEYLTGQASIDLFTSGTYFLDSRLNYRVTDRYNGSIELGYSRDQGLESTDPDFTTNIQQRLGINHNQTINPYSSLSANINLRTQDYYNRNSYDIDDRAEVSTNSRVAYNFNHPDGAYSFNIAGRHSQNFATDVTTLTGPDVSFSLRRITPFQQTGPRVDESWYESINIQYRSNLQSRYNYRPIDTDIGFLEALFNPSKHRQATGDFRHLNIGLRQTASVNAQLFSSEFVNLTSNISMNEYWYPQTLHQEWDPGEERIVSKMETGFASGRDFQTGVSANTTIYGMSSARIGRFEGFRHTIRPSVNFNYRPDFSEPFWGVYQEVQSNVDGDTRKYSTFEGGIVGGPGAGRQQTLGLSVGNTLETKEVRRDTTGERSESTIRLIDRLDFNASYNFAAESFNLSDLTSSITTSFFQNLRLNANATFSFYDTDDDGIRIDQYLWEESNQLMRLTNFTFRASTQFSGGGGNRGRFEQTTWHYPKHYDPLDQSRFHPIDQAIYDGQVHRIDVPWSMNVNFNYSWRRLTGDNIQRSAIVNAQSVQIRLTPEWQVGTSLGYDFVDGELTPSRFNVTRNLHCWDLTFQWNPFGDFKFFLFRLTVRDSQLQGLFQKLPGLNNLEQSSSPINRF